MKLTVWGAIALTLAALSLAALACGGGEEGGAGSDSTVRVIARDTRFNPDEITVTAGREVTLDLDNRDAFEHDLEVQRLEVDVVAGGSERPEHGGEHGSDARVLAVHANGEESASITFVASNPGTYEFYCTIPGHKDSGMVGTLIVESN